MSVVNLCINCFAVEVSVGCFLCMRFCCCKSLCSMKGALRECNNMSIIILICLYVQVKITMFIAHVNYCHCKSKSCDVDSVCCLGACIHHLSYIMQVMMKLKWNNVVLHAPS